MSSAMAILILFGLPFAMGVLVAVLWMRDQPVLLRALVIAAAFGAGAIAFRFTHIIAVSAHFDWNSGKLAPFVAMSKGYSLYQDRDSGVLSDWIYGPVPAFFYYATGLFQRPTSCIIAGVIINALLAIIPAMWAILISVRQGGRSAWLVGAFLAITFVTVSLSHDGLRRALYMVTPDAPTLGLICCSCCLLMMRRNWLNIGLSALFAVLGCWCKQSAVPFLIVPPLFLLAADGTRSVLRYLCLFVPIGLIVSTTLLLAFNPSRTLWQMVELPAKQQTYSPPGEPPRHVHFEDESNGLLAALWYGVGEWIVDANEPLLLLLAAIMLAAISADVAASTAASQEDRDADPPTWIERIRGGCRDYAREYPWIIFVMTAIALWPSGIIGYVKVYGYYNNFSLCTYFVLIAGVVGLVHLWPRIVAYRPQLAHLVVALICIFIFVTGITIDLTRPGNITSEASMLTDPYDNYQEVIYDYAKANPGVGYFPWNPLSTLLAEGKLYHFEWGFVDQLAAGLTPSAEQLSSHLPEHISFIAFAPVFQSANALKLFPRAVVPLEVNGLPGFHITTDPAIAAAARAQAEHARGVAPAASPSSGFDLSPRYGGN